MEELVDAKLVENIGISNFNKAQTERLMKNARIKPCNMQVFGFIKYIVVSSGSTGFFFI